MGKAAKAEQLVHSAGGFAVNILRQGQQDLSTSFAGGWSRPLASFAFVDRDGGPRLDGCAAAIGCATDAIHEGGDHWIVVGTVVALYQTAYSAPLICHGSRYASVGATFETEILVSGF